MLGGFRVATQLVASRVVLTSIELELCIGLRKYMLEDGERRNSIKSD
jgi:hypothetical protein